MLLYLMSIYNYIRGEKKRKMKNKDTEGQGDEKYRSIKIRGFARFATAQYRGFEPPSDFDRRSHTEITLTLTHTHSRTRPIKTNRQANIYIYIGIQASESPSKQNKPMKKLINNYNNSVFKQLIMRAVVFHGESPQPSRERKETLVPLSLPTTGN